MNTLFVRLFALMWVTLVASHLVAYALALPLATPDRPLGDAAERLRIDRLPTLPSLPPHDLGAGGPPRGDPGFDSPPPDGPGPGGPPPRQAAGAALWLDYALRALVIGIGALIGASWLSAPVRRLSAAAEALSGQLADGRPLPPLPERGTVETRAAARVFNAMAARLRQQFDARSLQMAALSHDLRTPLTRLRMRLDAAPPALAAAAAADIHAMSEMIDATLAVLREQRDAAEPPLLDLRSLLDAVVDDRRAVGDDVSLAAGPALRARARPAALRRIVDNLVDNALRHGGGAALALAPVDGTALITVDDRGPGIPAEQLDAAFRPWVRLAGSGAVGGHGLGLAIARDLAERDGATLTLENRAQGGLRAQLRLPSVSAPTRAPPTAATRGTDDDAP